MGVCCNNCDLNKHEITILKSNNENLNNSKKKNVYKIKYNEKYYIGFFFEILIEEMNKILILDKVIKEQNITIDVILDDNNSIKIDINSRILYPNNEDDIMIIELKNSDNLNNINFYGIDTDTSINENIDIYKIYYYNDNDIKISEIERAQNFIIIKDKKTSEEINIMGGLIINNSNNKVIGIIKNSNKNVRIWLKKSIEEFITIFEKSQKTRATNKNSSIIMNDKNENKNITEICPYIKALLLSFVKIEKLKQYFQNHDKKDGLTYLIYMFMNDYEQNSLNDDEYIINIGKKLKELDKKNVLENINFKNVLESILDELHNEVNIKQIINIEYNNYDYDENMAYKNFQNNYFQQNESQIQKLFFGVKEIITYFGCCKLEKYSFEICKYIYLELDMIKNENDLQKLINQWENNSNHKKLFCTMCNNDSENILIRNELYNSPEILIIIINNEIKIEIVINKILKTKKYEYKLISYVSEISGLNDFHVIDNVNNKDELRSNRNIEEDKIKINKPLKEYPFIVFYEKENIINNEKKDIYESLKEDININGQKNFNDKINDKNLSLNNINNIREDNTGNYINIVMNNNINNNNYNNIMNNDMNNIMNNNGMNKGMNNIINNIQYNNYNNFHVNNNNIYFSMNNLNNNINNSMNKMNNNINNNINYSINNNMNEFNNMNIMNNINNDDDKDEEITLYFMCNEKEMYLDVKNTLIFNKVIEELNNKYLWLKYYNISSYLYNGSKIDINKTVKENKLRNNSIIQLIEAN